MKTYISGMGMQAAITALLWQLHVITPSAGQQAITAILLFLAIWAWELYDWLVKRQKRRRQGQCQNA